jgi:predicted nuclease of predicted toxin-antitoxin system
MKILLDESIDVRFRTRLAGHDVFTISYMGRKSLKNGMLVREAAANGFAALVTTDRAMAQQLNLSGLPISVIILHAATNKLADLDRLVPALLATLPTLTPGDFAHVRP